MGPPVEPPTPYQRNPQGVLQRSARQNPPGFRKVRGRSATSRGHRGSSRGLIFEPPAEVAEAVNDALLHAKGFRPAPREPAKALRACGSMSDALRLDPAAAGRRASHRLAERPGRDRIRAATDEPQREVSGGRLGERRSEMEPKLRVIGEAAVAREQGEVLADLPLRLAGLDWAKALWRRGVGRGEADSTAKDSAGTAAM